MKYTAQTVANNVTSKVSMEVPIVPIGGSKSQYLHMLSRFRKAQRVLSWTNGATLYANFQNQMEDTSEWDAVSHPFAQSVQGFGEAINAHLLLLFPADAWEIHRNMVVNRTKGIKESPSEFMSRISFHDIVLGLLPGYPGQDVGAPDQQLTEYDKKQILYNGVPEEYREDFRKAGMSLTTEGLNNLIKYMDDLCNMDHTAQRALHSILILIQVTLDQLEESLAEAIALATVGLIMHLEEEDPMAVAIIIDRITGHTTLSVVAMVVATIKVKVKAHLKAIEVEQCPQEDWSSMAMEAGQHLLVGMEVIGLNPITVNLLEEVLSLITMPDSPEYAGMDTMRVGKGV